MSVQARLLPLLGLLAIVPVVLFGLGGIGLAAGVAVVNVLIIVGCVHLAMSGDGRLARLLGVEG